MVAIGGVLNGQRWRLAPTLQHLIAETDDLFPGRSTKSDGSIGDAGHQARVSDHNPGEDNIVSAVDITDDDAAGCDVGILLNHLVETQDDRVKYLIHKGFTWKSYDKNGIPAWTKIPYTGPNSHSGHLHISTLDSMLFATGPWWPTAATPPSHSNPIPILEVRRDKSMLFVAGTQLYYEKPNGDIVNITDCPEEDFWALAGPGRVPVASPVSREFIVKIDTAKAQPGASG